MNGNMVTTGKLKTKLQDHEVDVKIKENGMSGFFHLLNSMEDQIKKALPKHLTAERMIRIAKTAYSNNSRLRECDPMTIIAGVVQASQMGLEVNTALGHAFLIPYKNKKGRMEAQFQMGYKGELSLAYRTGKYKVIGAYKVYENDLFEYELGLTQILKHKPASIPKGEPIYYYAIYKTISGGEAFYVMSKEHVILYAQKYSQAYQKGWTSPWKTDFDSMAMKTCLRKVLNYAPKTIEYEQLCSQDGSVKKSIDPDMTLVQNEIIYDSIIEDGQKKIEEI